jgi:hypothetical protein
MAKRSSFNLSEAIRDYQKAHPSATANDALESLKEKHKGINDATFRSTFYKLKGGSKRVVRRLKPVAAGARGGGRRGGRGATATAGDGGDVIRATVEFIRMCGGIQQAKAAIDALSEL